MSSACGRVSSTASRLSDTALGLPGRFRIRLFFRITQTLLVNIARGVIRMEYARMAYGMPGTCLSATASVASGVTSRAVKPVPPVVRMRSI